MDYEGKVRRELSILGKRSKKVREDFMDVSLAKTAHQLDLIVVTAKYARRLIKAMRGNDGGE